MSIDEIFQTAINYEKNRSLLLITCSIQQCYFYTYIHTNKILDSSVL